MDTPHRSGGRRRGRTRTPTSQSQAHADTPSSGKGSKGAFVDGHWLCDCTPRQRAVLRETQKPGRNKGRWFYTCPQDRRRQCKFFLWEDAAGAVRGGVPATVPRPTYRTSMGRRTTPPADRPSSFLQDGVRPAPVSDARASLAQQLPLPSPPVRAPGHASGRQRTFTTPIYGPPVDDVFMRDADESSGPDDAPPSPTPTRRHRPPAHASDQPTDQPSDHPSDHDTGTPANPITRYFGIVKTTRSRDKDSKDRQRVSQSQGTPSSSMAGPVPLQVPVQVPATAPPTTRAGFELDPDDLDLDNNRDLDNNLDNLDNLDSDLDSESERVMVALADHTERLSRQNSRASLRGPSSDDSAGAGGIVVPLHADGGARFVGASNARPSTSSSSAVPELSMTQSTSTTATSIATPSTSFSTTASSSFASPQKQVRFSDTADVHTTNATHATHATPPVRAPGDHRVTQAVMLLLQDQNVQPHILQMVQTLINSALDRSTD